MEKSFCLHTHLLVGLAARQARAAQSNPQGAAPYSMYEHILSALRENRLEVLQHGGAAQAEILAEASESADPLVAERAKTVLGSLEKPEARDALCRLVTRQQHPHALAAALAAGYVPFHNAQRALYFFLTEQWARYDGLDADHALLKAVFEQSDARTRERIMDCASRAGRFHWVGWLCGVSQGRGGRRAALTDAEWAAALRALETHERWGELWRLALAAPAAWGARFVRRLEQSGWEGGERAQEAGLWRKLIKLARQATPAAPEISVLASLRKLLRGRGEDSAASALAFSPDERWLLSGYKDGTITIRRMPELTTVRKLKRHQATIVSLRFSPDGRVLVSGSEDSQVYLWDCPGGAPLEPPVQVAPHPVGPLAVDGNGNDEWTLAYLSSEASLQLAQLSPRGVVAGTSTAFAPDVFRLALHAGSGLLASARRGWVVDLWEIRAAESNRRLEVAPRHTINAARSQITDLAFSPGGGTLASAHHSGSVQLWDTKTGRLVNTLRDGRDRITCLAYSPSGEFIAASTVNGDTQLWSSELLRLSRLPPWRWAPEDSNWLERTLKADGASEAELSWLRLIQTLAGWQRRADFDVEAPRHVPPPHAFEIEEG